MVVITLKFITNLIGNTSAISYAVTSHLISNLFEELTIKFRVNLTNALSDGHAMSSEMEDVELLGTKD